MADDINIDRVQLTESASDEMLCEKSVLNHIQTDSSFYYLLAEQAAALDKTYILDLSVKECGNSINATVALSDNSCKVYELNNNELKQLFTLNGHTESITNVKFSHNSDHILYSSSLDGTVKTWDLRVGDSVKELKDTNGIKPLTCLDLCCNDRIICAGTELVEGDAFVLFWDVRAKKLLGGYWESHMDEVTKVKCHPTSPNIIATSSTDGLINVFDIGQANEDDALQHSLNAESAVLKLNWTKCLNDWSGLSAVLDIETTQMWKIDESFPYDVYSRSSTAKALQIPADDLYVVDVHQNENGDVNILAGSTAGKSECLQLLGAQEKKLVPRTNLKGNRQIVRSSHYLPNNGLLFTGGESGILNVWKPGIAEASHTKKSNKLQRTKKHKTKPY